MLRRGEWIVKYAKRSARFFAAVCLLLAFGTCSRARAVDPADVPWDEIDRVLKETPDGPATSPQRGTGAESTTDDHSPADAGADRQNETDRLATRPEPQSGNPAAPRAAVTTPEHGAESPADWQTLDKPPPSLEAINAPSVTDEPEPQATPDAAGPSALAQPAARPAPATPNGDLIYLPAARFLEANGKKTLSNFNEADRQVAIQFYGSRMGAPIWVAKTGFTDDAKNLMAAFRDAENWGLRATDYKVPDLSPNTSGEFNFDDLTNAEVRLSLAAMQYARDARGDRITDPPTQLGSYIDRKPQLFDRRTFLETLAKVPDKGDYLRSLHPKHPQFELLRQKLIALRLAAKDTELLKVPDGPKLLPGKSHPHIAVIRKILKVPSPSMKADFTPADETYYDDDLARAVAAYKEKKGIDPVNPVITSALRRSLNTINDISEWKLLANMEEWRWMPEDLGKFYVNVNIPEFMVRVVKNGEVIHEERIVSGRVDTQTPIFSDLMRTVVFQPRWNVPNSIKIKELLPGLRAGGDPLRRQGLVLERNGRRLAAGSIDWTRTDIRNFDVYQPPGGGNALGVVKFLFPNKHSVYLHDTPSKGLFNESVRAFSHGCMRVRNPVRLAEVVLNEDKGWDPNVIADLIANGPEENQVALTHPIPVHVTYFTARMEGDGTVETFNDVYGHERRIALALQGRWNEIVKANEPKVSPDEIAIDGDGWFTALGDDATDPRKKKKSGDFGKFLQQIFGGF